MAFDFINGKVSTYGTPVSSTGVALTTNTGTFAGLTGCITSSFVQTTGTTTKIYVVNGLIVSASA